RHAADAGRQQSRGAQRELSVTVALERDLVVTTGREDHLSHGGLRVRGRAPARGAQPLTESAVRRLHLGGGGQEARAHVAAAVGGRRPHHEPGDGGGGTAVDEASDVHALRDGGGDLRQVVVDDERAGGHVLRAE